MGSAIDHCKRRRGARVGPAAAALAAVLALPAAAVTPASNGNGPSVTPSAASVTFTQTQRFALQGGAARWAVDGVPGGNATTGTITAGGLYSPPHGVGTHKVTATTVAGAASRSATVYVSGYPGTFTFQNDASRSGQNLSETVLTRANVNASTFGKLFSDPLDGLALASPLYAANLSIPGKGFHNVVFVATEHDSVYAFDADRPGAPLWRRSFIRPAAGVTTVPAAATGETGDIPHEIGITSTPTIDPATNTMYVVAATKEVTGGSTSYVQRLHALDIQSGAEKLGGPVVITARVPGIGRGSVDGQLTFEPLRENQRPGLLLAGGVVYLGFSSHGDYGNFHGWLLGYNASTLQQSMVFCATPDGHNGGIWMAGDGPATDSTGSIYFVTADGSADAFTNNERDYGDAFVRLSPAGAVEDYFIPSIQHTLDGANLDLGSGGLLLLPDQSGGHPHEMLSAGKNGTIYVVDRDNLGGYHANGDQIVQSLPRIFPKATGEIVGNFGSPVYFDGNVYFSPPQDNVQAFRVSHGLLSRSPTSRSVETYADRGGTISVSANGSKDGILWALQTNGADPGVLHAYDAGNLKDELYSTDQAGPRDALDAWSKFTVPVVANGKVYVTSSRLTIYGLLPVAAPAIAASQPRVTALTTNKPRLTLTLTAPKPASLRLTLLNAAGRAVARWSVNAGAGMSKLSLPLPAGARRPGHDTLRLNSPALAATGPQLLPVLVRT